MSTFAVHTETVKRSAPAVDIVRTETVKPSAPTPPHLSTLKFSAMDQHEAPLYIHQFYFYSSPPAVHTGSIVDRLKESLSETLTLFYPFAGRIVDNQYVDCNDRGVDWLEAQVDAQMTDFLADPAAEDLVRMKSNHADVTMLLSVQVNVFACGGVALGMCLTHQICDPASLVFFVTTWAAVTRGDTEIVPPKFCAPSLFPPAPAAHAPLLASSLFSAGPKLTSKMFEFSASDIAALQTQCAGATRVGAVTSHIWRCLVNAAQTTSCALGFTMNLRTLMDPPLPSSYMGNLVLALLATSTAENRKSRPTLPNLASLIHAMKKKIDSNYVRKLQVDHTELFSAYASHEKVMSEVGLGVAISSLCRAPIYDADFGWGKPEWVTFLNMSCPNMIVLMDTKCGTGIQAWVTLDEQESDVARIMKGLKVQTSRSRM